MSNFASIAVLSKPTEQHPDWEFEMEGLKFEVHEGLVELNQEITDFDKFCTSMESLFALVDSIDMNRGRLDEAVYSLVNQNNELAEALGIYTPFSFATEEEQAQAGQEVKDAVNNGDKKDEEKKDGDSKDGGDDKGFFAKAWDAIKRFFAAIKNALIRVWGAITGSNKNAQAQADEISNDAKTSPDAGNKAVATNLVNTIKGEVRFCSFVKMSQIAAACLSISNKCASLAASPEQYIEWRGKAANSPNEDSFKAAIKADLEKAGYKESTSGQNGIESKSFNLEREKEPNEVLIESWSNANNRASLSNLCRSMETYCEKIRKTIENLTTASENILKDPKKLEALADKMALGTWNNKPHLQQKIALWKRVSNFATGAADKERAQYDALNKKIDEHNKSMRAKRNQAQLQLVMEYEKDLANYLKETLSVVRTLKADFEATIAHLHKVVKRFNVGSDAVARSKAEKERNEANARDAQAYRDAANAAVTKSMQEDDKKHEADHAEDMDTATPDYDNN